MRLANVAAGMEVERTGVAVIYRDEIRREAGDDGLRQRGEDRRAASTQAVWPRSYRRRGRTVVFTNGCFDLLHVGHVSYLSEAAKLGNTLIVGVNSDASVRRLKGSSRPVIAESDRAAMLAALACVGYVVVFDEDTPHRLLEAIRPDVLVKGGTYTPSEVVGHEIVEAYGGTRVRDRRGRRRLDHEDPGSIAAESGSKPQPDPAGRRASVPLRRAG